MSSSTTEAARIRAIDLSREFFEEIIQPALQRACPDVMAQAACGRFGLGSECIDMDDAISRDHHWGPRVDILLPDEVFHREAERLVSEARKVLPDEFRGFKLERGHVGGAGLAPEPITGFLMRSIGRTSPPQSLRDWLEMPEEDIIHVINGEVWHDGPGQFTRIREVLLQYYPDPVWKRRIAHWCRYCSGMALYAMQRALLRSNWPYMYFGFGRTLKLTMELTFLLNRQYFPYDKWLYPMFQRLPRLAPQIDPLIQEATRDETSWERRIELCEKMHDVLDREMVNTGLIRPHPRYKRSATSGYRLLEHAYADLIQQMPDEIRTYVPLWDQKFLEIFHSGFVAGLSLDDWDGMLNLHPTES